MGACIYDVRNHVYIDAKATRIRGSRRLDPNALNRCGRVAVVRAARLEALEYPSRPIATNAIARNDTGDSAFGEACLNSISFTVSGGRLSGAFGSRSLISPLNDGTHCLRLPLLAQLLHGASVILH